MFLYGISTMHRHIKNGSRYRNAEQHHVLHALVEPSAKSDALLAAWQRHVLQSLVERIAKGDALQAGRQRQVLHALVELAAKGDAPDTFPVLRFAVSYLKQLCD